VANVLRSLGKSSSSVDSVLEGTANAAPAIA
jgi:hypothetical protein